MKHRLAILAVLVALAAAGSALAVTNTRARSGNQSLDLTGIVTGFHIALDARPAGHSPGDIGYETGNLFMKSKPAGRFQGICTQLAHASSQCSFTLGLSAGQIVIDAAYGPGFNTGNLAREAVVGGTGAYAGARGQGLDRELTNTKIAFHLELSQ